MKISIILAHPDMESESFNHAIAETAFKTLKQNNHQIYFHDLYNENFNAIITKDEIPSSYNYQNDTLLAIHCEEISSVDGIIIIHPNWWGMPPAILKGWIDRVLRPGVTYKFNDGDNGEGVPIGLLKAKTGLVFNTSNTSEDRENNLFQDPLETIWKNCIFNFCGVKNFYRKMFRIVVTSTLEERQKWLSEVEIMINKYFPE